MASRGEKILVLELMTTEVLVTVKELQNGRIPRPSQYIASLVAYGVLGGVAAIGDEWAELSAALGAVVLLTTLVNENATPLLSLFKAATGGLSGSGGKSSSGQPGQGPTTGGMSGAITPETWAAMQKILEDAQRQKGQS